MSEEQNKDRPGLFHYESAAERVTSPQRIGTVLKSMQTERCILTVTIPRVGERYISAVLKVDIENGSLWLDELAPQTGHIHFTRTGVAHVNASLHGIGIHFRAVLQEEGEKGGVAWYRVACPDLVHYLQRRTAFRVPVSSASPVAVHVEPWVEPPPPEDEPPLQPPPPFPEKTLHGRLRDISRGGVGILLPRGTEIHRGRILGDCVIDIPDHEPLRCRLQACHSFHESLSNMLRVGARFLDLDNPQRRIVEHFARTLERAELRKHVREVDRPWEPVT